MIAVIVVSCENWPAGQNWSGVLLGTKVARNGSGLTHLPSSTIIYPHLPSSTHNLTVTAKPTSVPG